MSKEIVDNLAEKVLEDVLKEVDEKSRYGIDPITIIMIIAIIVNVIRVIQECNKQKLSTLAGAEQVRMLSTDVNFRAFHNSFWTRMKIKKIIKNHLDPKQYKLYNPALLKVLLEIGKTVKEEQVSALLEYK